MMASLGFFERSTGNIPHSPTRLLIATPLLWPDSLRCRIAGSPDSLQHTDFQTIQDGIFRLEFGTGFLEEKLLQGVKYARSFFRMDGMRS
jgi:hypothetical protein